MVYWTYIAVCLAVASVIAYFFLAGKNKKQVTILYHDWKPDVVYLYQFPRSKTIPNLSMFCLKVETFLKTNKIPYQVCSTLIGRSQYGKLPFIELNGKQIADSQIIVNCLTDHFKLKSPLNPKDEAIARTVERMAENHTFLVLYHFKLLVKTNDIFSVTMRDLGVPGLLIPFMTYLMKRKITKRTETSLGPFSTEDFKVFLKKDYDAYRDLIGDQKFLFGDEITAVDCSVFGQLATTHYAPVANYASDLLQKEYPTLVAYLDRIRDTVFGDEFEQH